MDDGGKSPKVAVLIPCYNESRTVAGVVSEFRRYLPKASIYVYDNFSEDGTAKAAKQAGASVRSVIARGKGNVVRQMFYAIDADIYVMVDGDATYDAADALRMVDTLVEGKLDMIIAVRRERSESAYRNGHRFGNFVFNSIVKLLFGSTFRDIFSGYRIFSKRFVKTFPSMSNGFDIETELTIHALTLTLPCAEMESDYFERPKNSYSKLKTCKDGFLILIRIIRLLKEVRPMFFFGVIALILFLLSIGISYPILLTFIQTGLVPRLPTAVLATGIVLASLLSFTCGVILESVSQLRIEVKKLHYLQIKHANNEF
ncbi:MAG: glycosyltransferase family 2 protein [Holosporaceae bacterium]|jgi:glycosyltransferase involved in cell wall biosynthesis|nr:glycosyltransferase family 2 protein [Holosporaceae bacterium]